jgi:hypothetical protein
MADVWLPDALVTGVHDGHANGPIPTDADLLRLFMRRMNAEDFARVFRKSPSRRP